MLEPAPSEDDPYNQIEGQHSDSVKTEGTEGDEQVYKIERLVDKRSRRYGRSASRIEYLIK